MFHGVPMDTASYTIVLEPSEEGGYNVIVSALPGCVTQGKTYEEAVTMAQDAIGLWLEVLARKGEPIPREPATFGVALAKVEVAVPAGT